MADLIKAFVLFTFGFVILANLGDALDKKSGAAPSGDGASAPYAGASASAAFTPGAEVESGSEEEDPSSTATKTVVRNGSYAQSCASFDPVAHPEQVVDILEYASEVTGTPVEVLYAVWRKETGHFDGAGLASGRCDVMEELALRDRAAGTHHASSMLSMAKEFGWDKQYGDRLQGMTCSCPGRDKETGERKGFGGCCGPFQFSGQEVERFAIVNGLDPMTFCGGAVIAGWELKQHHDAAFKPRRTRNGTIPGRGTVIQAKYQYPNPEYAAWHAAMSRYYGGDEGGVYGRTAMAKLMEFYSWRPYEERQPGYIISKILGMEHSKMSLRYLRGLRSRQASYASN